MDGETGNRLEELVRSAVRSEVGSLFDELRRFVDRRIAELGTEINATVELVDFSGNHVSQKLQQMQDELGRVVAMPAAATRNSGLELEGIVQATEEAANRIMSAAERIRDCVGQGVPVAAAAAIVEQVNAIFEACTFQDLTGQRIRRAIHSLQTVEEELAEIVEQGSGQEAAARPKREPVAPIPEITGSGPDLAQDEIDKLLAG
jgi:chemotaxis protein CheZ